MTLGSFWIAGSHDEVADEISSTKQNEQMAKNFPSQKAPKDTLKLIPSFQDDRAGHQKCLASCQNDLREELTGEAEECKIVGFFVLLKGCGGNKHEVFMNGQGR